MSDSSTDNKQQEQTWVDDQALFVLSGILGQLANIIRMYQKHNATLDSGIENLNNACRDLIKTIRHRQMDRRAKETDNVQEE